MKTEYAFAAVEKGLSLQYFPGENHLEGAFELPEDFVVFNGHFENNPVMPGVTYILFAELIARRALGMEVSIKSLKRTKFFRPAFPGQKLLISGTLTPEDGGVYSCVLNFTDDAGQKFCSLKSQVEKL
jgi:3-hydroxymyristoyl/3-hydroxydecanoyl-(acyl carrier protein) dehydratase